MWTSLLMSTTCVLGLAAAATFSTKPVPEDPAHPAQCYDEGTKTWHKEHETWKRGGECLESRCSLTVGFMDVDGDLRHLEEISPGVYSRFQADPGRTAFSSDSRNGTLKFSARGTDMEYVFVEGDEAIRPQAFVSEHVITCFYHIKLPSNCMETKGDNSLPYPACCPKLECSGQPLGPIEALG